MEQVSGRDWGDLATEVDLDHLAALTKRDIEGLDRRMYERLGELQELGEVYNEPAAHTRTIALACVASVMSSTAVALGSARL